MYKKVTEKAATARRADGITAEEVPGVGESPLLSSTGGVRVFSYMTRPSIPMSLISSVPSSATAA